MKSFMRFLIEEVNHENIDHFKEIPGTRKGSNEGGVFHDPHTGDKHYVKFYKNPTQAKEEVAAGGIYKMIGAKTVDHRLVTRGGRLGVASKWNPDLEPQNKQDFTNMSEPHKHDIAKHFMGAVLTKNWDAVGLHHDNIMKHKYTDEYHTADVGGSFEHRAQGAIKPSGPSGKPYGPDIGEFHSLRNPDLNPEAHHVFSQLGSEHIASAKQGLNNLSYSGVHTLFNSVGLSNPADKTDALMARKAELMKV